MKHARQIVFATMMCGAACVAAPSAAHAQGVSFGRIEVGAGVSWSGGTSFGTAAAAETAPSGRFTLFSTSNERSAAVGADVRVGVRLTPRFAMEASSTYSRPTLRSVVSGDVENGAPVTATDALRQITIDGAAIVNLAREQRVRHAMPFVLAGAGYLRQLHEGDTLIATGQRYFAGGGVALLLMSRPHGLKSFGVRADARALVQRKGAALDGRTHTSPVVAGSMFVRF